jgi:hypothetical protein
VTRCVDVMVLVCHCDMVLLYWIGSGNMHDDWMG